MNHQDKFLLPDKSFWQALNGDQRKALISKYTIICPPILLTEIAKGELSKLNAMLNMENIFTVPKWWERAKTELITRKSSEPMPFTTANATKSIFDNSEQEIAAFQDSASQFIETKIDREDDIQNRLSIIAPSKEKILSLVYNTDNLSNGEWVDRLKEMFSEFQQDYPDIAHTIKMIDTTDFSHEQIKSVKKSLKAVCNSFETNSWTNAYQVATNLLHHDPGDQGRAYEILQRLCMLLKPIFTQDERTKIFNRYLKEDMPSINKFAPYALGAMIWHMTIHLYLRENPKDAAPSG